MREQWKIMTGAMFRKNVGENRPEITRSRVGFWLGALLFFVPVFYFLLLMKPFSVKARVGWALWLGLIVFVKASGLSDPVLDLRSIEEEVRRSEIAGLEESGSVLLPEKVRTDQPLPEKPLPEKERPPSLERYLSRLESGVLGIYVESSFEESPAAIVVRFRREDGYFDSERALVLAALATGFAVFYGRDYRQVRLEFDYRGEPVRFALERSAFNRFFGMSEEAMRELAEDHQKFAASTIKNLDGEGQDAFFAEFARRR